MPEWQHVFVSVACEETAGTHVVTLRAFRSRGGLSAVGRIRMMEEG